MRFLLLLSAPDHYRRWDAMSPAESEEAFAAFRRFASAVQARGELVDGDALVPPADGRIVGIGADRKITDGPYAETVEQVSGYYVIDVADLDVATELATLLPNRVAVEVRPTRGVQIR
jgi:hypothetical protein